MSQRSKRRRSSAGAGGDGAKEPKVSNLKGIIIDNGAYSIKIGYSHEDEPNIIPNCIMKAKSERKRLFVGKQIDECRDCSSLFYLLPCEKGYITRWEVQKPVWDHSLSKNVCPIGDNPVIITQPLFNFKSIQDCMDEIFFEEYEAPSLFRINPTDLAELKYTNDFGSSPEESVVVVDTGYSFTHVIPYIKGNKYLRAIKRLNVGGKLLTNHLKDIISYRQYNVMEETYVINQVKEDTCYVAENIQQELKEALKPLKENKVVKNYVLPDFNTIRRGFIQDPETKTEVEEDYQMLRLNNERFAVPEILFNPSDIGMKTIGIAEAIVKSIFLCPKEYQQGLAKNIVLIGGNCKFAGFKERMYKELRSLLPNEWDLKVFLPENPLTYAWQGGKELLKIPDFEKSLITREQYSELGSTAIQQRSISGKSGRNRFKPKIWTNEMHSSKRISTPWEQNFYHLKNKGPEVFGSVYFSRFNSFMTDNSQPSENETKKNQHFSYLERLKSRAIFGKTDPFDVPEGDQPNPFDTTLESDKITTRQSKDTDRDSSINLIEDGTQETTLNASEMESNGPTKLGRRPKKAEVVDYIELQADLSEEEDLTQNPELFPLGTDSYL